MRTTDWVCPLTKRPLVPVDALQLGTEDGDIRYPVRDGIPVLMGPEAITSIKPWPRDTLAPQYAEAYTEMEFYNSVAGDDIRELRTGGLDQSNSDAVRHLGKLAKLTQEERSHFPEPEEVWHCDTIDIASARHCYRHIGSVEGKRVLQIGGKGTRAILFLLAGASEAVLLTPMHGEALIARELATILGVQDRLSCALSVGEEIPIADSYVDVCWTGGCIHHMVTELAFPEIARVLRPSGKFAAAEPFKALGYTIGTKIFGKRERNVFCRPLTVERVVPLHRSFGNAQCIRSGAFTRYPAIVAEKAGIRFTVPIAKLVADVDCAMCKCLPFAKHLSSGAALLATK